MHYPVTPDGRYFMVRGGLWRVSDPALGADRRDGLVRDLMHDRVAGAAAKAAGDSAKRALGERGEVW